MSDRAAILACSLTFGTELRTIEPRADRWAAAVFDSRDDKETDSMHQLGLGIVGTGMIAGVIAEAITQSTHGRLVAVSSRRLAGAKQFTARFPGAAAVEGIEALLAQPGLDAIYVATPTVAKEKIALAAIAAGKHVLVDKPFIDEASVLRMSQAAAARGLVFLDATHFVHHPRTAAIRAATAERIGSPRSLHTAFYFPFADRDNIRFDPKQEPTGVLGDMAWYSMRAIVEYLRRREPSPPR